MKYLKITVVLLLLVWSTISPVFGTLEQTSYYLKNTTELTEFVEKSYEFIYSPISVSTHSIYRKPDLYGGDMSISDYVYTGETITIYDIIYNSGPGDAKQSTIRYYLSKIPEITTISYFLVESILPGINAGKEEPVKISLTIPDNIRAGEYYIIRNVDPDNSVQEINEQNNIGSNNYPIIVTDKKSRSVIDITSIGTDISSPVEQGAYIFISDYLINNGDADANPFFVTYYLSPDKSLSNNSIKIGSQLVYGLNKGEELIANIEIDLPKNLEPGFYYFFKYIDEEGSLPYEIRNNNIWYNNEPIEIIQAIQEIPPITALPTPVRSDTLILTSLIYESVAFIGEAFAPAGTLYNGLNGMIPVAQVSYYLSKNKKGALKGQYLGDWKEMRMMPYETRTIEKVMQIPQNTIPGYYYITATIEAIGITGFRENTWVSPSQILIKYSPDAPFPDLTHIKIDVPDCANPGGDITITDTISNSGNACADDIVVEYYLSKNSQFDKNALLVGQWNAGSICPGQQMTETLKIPIPDSYPLGMYYFFGVIDPCDDPCVGITELDEDNNIIMRPIELSRCVFCS